MTLLKSKTTFCGGLHCHSLTVRGTAVWLDCSVRQLSRIMPKKMLSDKKAYEMVVSLNESDSDAASDSEPDREFSWTRPLDFSSSDGSEDSGSESPPAKKPRRNRGPVPTATAPTETVPPTDKGTQETGRDGTVWRVLNPIGDAAGQRAAHIFKGNRGPTQYARQNINSALSAFLCLFDMDMLRHVRECTVEEGKATSKDSSWDMTLDELQAFIALLYVRGAYGGKSSNLESFWSDQWGLGFFRQTMPRNRFREIMRFLCFDRQMQKPKKTRKADDGTDPFAPASVIWNGFVNNSIACYNPGENISVDSQLFPSKARCDFMQFMATKPERHGIKFWLAADVDTKYMVNGFPDFGRNIHHPRKRDSNVVLRLMEPYLDEGRNVTTDHGFTSLELAKTLLDRKTTIVGMVNKCLKELPPSVHSKQSELYSTTVLRHDDATLTVYSSEPQKNISIISTLHMAVGSGTDKRRKPETLTFYNTTQVGVYVLDRMARMQSVKGGARRWPVAVFYNVLDLAAVNAFVLYRECTGENGSNRREFILKLATELRKENLIRKTAIQPDPCIHSPGSRKSRKTCQVGKCNKNRTPDRCIGCRRYVCGTCTKRAERICVECNL